ncbi:cytochrome b5 domain-containing protein [Oscillatoria sp. FACHB-1407]|uniref:cytochrome b5-like heme/steroid binding domain-containing protein n=1 Tax=Oscillatoria sp. FACHB-1407 TaxID=2692847 RepID=UPI001685E241|nr:cytochrome b5-like heme/steroid binding domain-containing protein [Oscillatoria sp. FACHB-1407]MBD2461276.1 cytochrome b5 domain-containing protein [Oscillatoria sp. FACHB-1407]
MLDAIANEKVDIDATGQISTLERPAPPVNQSGYQPAPPPTENGEEPPPPPVDGAPLPNVWIYEGQAYDLTDFLKKHPGGEFFIGRTKNRDITAIVNIFHRNPEKVKKVLQKYALGRQARPEDIHPKYNAPAFLFRDGFNGWRDTPRYNFPKDQLLNQIRARLNEPVMKQQVERMDFLFDVVTVLLVIAYFLLQVLRLNFTAYMPIYVFVPLMVMLKISLSGVGHYLIHRPQVRFNKFFANIFDINYVPLTLVVTDGHSLMHHPFTQTDVDIKQNVFTAMLELPRYYRIPIHTMQKIGHVISGMFGRIVELMVLACKVGVSDMYGSWLRGLPHFLGALTVHAVLLAEMVLFTIHGDFLAWFAQFFITLWISTFMIVASHDFEEEETAQDDSQDWAVLQIKNSYDLTMVGNKYLDCFLSAGLSPHRVHHVLPFQRSGFANIISEDIVREEAAKFNVAWLPPKNFFIDRLPILINHYLFSPSRLAHENKFGLFREHLHPQALRATVTYIIQGFIGVGSI